MNSSKLTSTISILANLAVLGGLVLVGLQLNQNYELLRIQMIEQESRRMSDHEGIYVGEIGAKVWAKVLEDPVGLTLEEQRIAESLIWPAFEAWKTNYRLFEAGLLERDAWMNRVVAEVPYYLGHAYGHAWWKNFKEQSTPGEIPTELLQAIDEVLTESPNAQREYHEAIMRYVAEGLENDA